MVEAITEREEVKIKDEEKENPLWMRRASY